jgi:predicted transcriptional regulator of viral defense system
MKKDPAREYMDSLQSRGQYFFLKRELLSKTGQAELVANRSLARLQAKNRILLVRRGFYLIIPIEFRSTGVLPPEWSIHSLMDYLGIRYYVGLLSAAAIWGASHQKAQEFQVLTNVQLRAIHVKILKIRFFKNARFPNPVFLIQQKTETGFMWVSNPELTAFDLMKYAKAVGGLNLLATTFSELGESIDATRLLDVAKKEKNLAFAQRLGFMLDHAGFKAKTREMAEFIRRKNTRPVKLEPGLQKKIALLNKKWNILENLQIEADEI